MRNLYPEIAATRTLMLETGGPHRVYVEECGNPEGVPVIFLHGGPGSGCNENHRRYFDPDRYRIVIFDQRGCNRSTPRGAVEDNDTGALLEDMEQIRREMGVDRWLLYGGSWGATLALLYAEAHPDRVTAMILRGAFLARRRDLEWFIRDGASRIFPEYWKTFLDFLPEAERGDPVAAYHARVHGADRKTRRAAAFNWTRWAGRIVTWNLPDAANYEPTDDPDTLIHEVGIETHYAKNSYFIEDNQIVANAGRLPEVPVHIIHGRRDLTCTLEASWALHGAMPGAQLQIVNDGGHLAGEPAMTNALVAATDAMAKRLA